MTRFVKQSISNQMLLIIMSTTFIALFAYAGAMLAYDLNTYRSALIKDLKTQATLIGEVSAPAIEFNDPTTATENLRILRTRKSILRAVIFTPEGRIFAEYINKQFPVSRASQFSENTEGHSIEKSRVHLWHPIVINDEKLGTVYIKANYEARERLLNYAIILAYVMAGSLGIALLVAIWLRGAITKPILAVTRVAREVMQTRDFSLRVKKYTKDEIGLLADAVNDMLREVERRTRALQESNESLEHEMAERNAAEAALRLADLRKDEFLATLAHELRNPLAPLSSSLEVLRLIKDPAEEEKSYAIMDRQFKKMVRLVNDLLDVSRINTGKLTISKMRIDIQSVIQDAIETSHSFIESCNHKLIVNLPSEPVYIDADPLRLAQVFSNILNNAAKYTDTGGEIRIDARLESEDQLCVSISDNGIGIEADMLHEIFNMFTQVNRALDRTHAGLGVGLALAKHLIELHGYTLEVFSEGLGKGSSFLVRFSLSSVPQNAHETPSIKSHKIKPCRIMLVDDNVDYVTAMASLLELKGHTVRVAHDGFKALEIAREFSPQIAFLDIGMPGMSGHDLAQHLRQLPETQHSILVAITGWGQENDRQLSRAAGFDHHLVKPVQLEQLIQLINESLNQ
jgi:signal transduction histidine kinase